MARSEKDRDGEEEQSEGAIREDEDEDEIVEGGAESSDVAVTFHRFKIHCKTVLAQIYSEPWN